MRMVVFSISAAVIAIAIIVACGKDDNKPGPGKVQIGTPAVPGMSYAWTPVEGLSDPSAAQPFASPKKTTTYTVTVTSKCGTASSQVKVRVYDKAADNSLVEIL